MIQLEAPTLEIGIRPSLLLEQVKNTAPYLFESNLVLDEGEKFIEILKNGETLSLIHRARYFEFAIAAHFATVGTFVPTDVDVHIRQKLWGFGCTDEALIDMCESVVNFRGWTEEKVSRRYLKKTSFHEKLSGHQGEWFSIAVPAYSVSLKKWEKISTTILEMIESDLIQHFETFQFYLKNRQMRQLHEASVLITHNLGDLKRVNEAWGLAENDPLVKVTAAFEKKLSLSSSLYKEFFALENHRHFALRRPRGLRREMDLLLGVGPFFESWGESVASHPRLTDFEKAETIQALIDGYFRLNEKAEKPIFGYARALLGMTSKLKNPDQWLRFYLPKGDYKKLKEGMLRQALSLSSERFEKSLFDRMTKFIRESSSTLPRQFGLSEKG